MEGRIARYDKHHNINKYEHKHNDVMSRLALWRKNRTEKTLNHDDVKTEADFDIVRLCTDTH